MNIANRCNSQIGGALENLKPASPQERAALEGAALLYRAFTFSMWVKKILILHTPQIPKGKYLLSALPFPSRQRWWLFLASRKEEERPCREVCWASPSPSPAALQTGPLGCYERARDRFSENGGKIHKSCLKASVGRNLAPRGAEAVSESKKMK